jgi:hypothetical protein
MSTYKTRSDYFKMIANKNKLIAHDRPIAVGSDKLRKSFHRINDEDELNAACVNWAHFPCVVHIGYDIHYRENDTGLPRRITVNRLLFLTKTNTKDYAALSDAIEVAYDEANQAMSKFISFMRQDMEDNAPCGDLFLFDMNRALAEMVGPINTTLFGWQLTLLDEAKAVELKYQQDDWFDS